MRNPVKQGIKRASRPMINDDFQEPGDRCGVGIKGSCCAQEFCSEIEGECTKTLKNRDFFSSGARTNAMSKTEES